MQMQILADLFSFSLFFGKISQAASYLLNLFKIRQQIHFRPIFFIWATENFYHQCELLDVGIPLKFSQFNILFNPAFCRKRRCCFLFALQIFQFTLNSGIRLNISANTHPIAHISTAGPYFDEPYSNSGARYHRLATYH